jgi:4'-phosphopantetheinyl transferase
VNDERRMQSREAIHLADIGQMADVVAKLPHADLDDAQRYTLPRRKRQFLAGRALMRLALASRHGLAFDEIRFEAPGGAPRVAGRTDLGLSLSHSANDIGCALAEGHDCGFDLQRKADKPLLDIAEAFFTPDEHRKLAALEGTALADSFYELWTLKEAWAKASGHALMPALARVSLAPGNASGTSGWSAWLLTPSPGTAAALVAAADQSGEAPAPPSVAVWNGSAFEAASIDCERIELAIKPA